MLNLEFFGIKSSFLSIKRMVNENFIVNLDAQFLIQI